MDVGTSNQVIILGRRKYFLQNYRQFYFYSQNRISHIHKKAKWDLRVAVLFIVARFCLTNNRWCFGPKWCCFMCGTHVLHGSCVMEWIVHTFAGISVCVFLEVACGIIANISLQNSVEWCQIPYLAVKRKGEGNTKRQLNQALCCECSYINPCSMPCSHRIITSRRVVSNHWCWAKVRAWLRLQKDNFG